MDITTWLYRAAVTITTVAAATLGGAGLASAVTQPPAHGAHRITEDDPRWDCRTMGNHTCGAGLPSWAHWKTAPRGACSHGTGIVVWAGHGDGVLICANGDTETS